MRETKMEREAGQVKSPLRVSCYETQVSTCLPTQDEEEKAPASPHAIMEDLRAAEQTSREAHQALSSPRRNSPRCARQAQTKV